MKSWKNRQLISSLEDYLDNMCGVGTRLVKLFLNGKIKEGDDRALVYRQLLESEMLNINAKRYNNTFYFDYRESYYKKKADAIAEMVRTLLESNPLGVVFGKESSDVSDTKYIIYFDVPDCGQISFHTDIPSELLPYVPDYGNEWDGEENSVLRKLQDGINKFYGDEIRKKYAKQFEERERRLNYSLV